MVPSPDEEPRTFQSLLLVLLLALGAWPLFLLRLPDPRQMGSSPVFSGVDPISDWVPEGQQCADLEGCHHHHLHHGGDWLDLGNWKDFANTLAGIDLESLRKRR